MSTWEEKLGLADPETLKTLHEDLGKEEIESAYKEASFDSMQVQDMAKNSLDFLAALAMPTVFRYLFPEVFQAIWKWLLSYVHKERDFSQLAIGLPRGFAKTTFIKIFLLYVILFTKRTFILICANNEKKAIAILSDVMDFLDEPNIKKVFGDWRLGVETDQQGLKKFGFRGRNIILYAGTVATVRGLNLKHQRPDVMLFDDIQSREDADSETISKQIESDLYGTAMKAKSPHGCLYIFVANMYPTKWSLLRRIKNNPTWVKFIAGALLSNGKSIWEELQPTSQLIKEFENDLASGKPEVFYAEVLNDENASVNNLVDLSKLPAYNIPPDEIHQGNFIIIDPSNDKVNSDAVSIMYFEIHQNIPVCKKTKEGRLSPGETIEEALKIGLEKNCRVIAIESNAFQYSLNYWFNFICAQKGIIGFYPVEIYSGSYSKNSRILTMFKQLLAGEVLIHPECAAACNLQISQFNPLKRDNTDGLLDCLTYAPKVIELYADLILSSLEIIEQDNTDLYVWDERINSPF